MAKAKKAVVVATPVAPKGERKVTKTSKKIEDMAQGVFRAAKRQEDPQIEIPVRALSNVRFDEKRRIIEMGDRRQSRLLFDLKQARSFMQTMLVAASCK